MKNIVISGVNLRKGGTLAILRQCLEYLSEEASEGHYHVTALVHKRSLCDFPNIQYIEIPWSAKSWALRLWCEYVTMHKISKKIEKHTGPIDLWLSMHDTTPRVKAKRQAVYCQTSFPFLKWNLKDLRFDPKIVLFALFTRLAYQINIRRNCHLIVQAEWLRSGFSKIFRLPRSKFIVAPPTSSQVIGAEASNQQEGNERPYSFLYVSTGDRHKNFETLCQAAMLLENELGTGRFIVNLSIDGNENRYTAWVKRKWGEVESLHFCGFMDKNSLDRHYSNDDCFVFPSRVETWGLPITEFGSYGKPMLLADLPYAHETAAGKKGIAFFPATDATMLAEEMKRILNGDLSHLQDVESRPIENPTAADWNELFNTLLN